jgi:hypothetical protein
MKRGNCQGKRKKKERKKTLDVQWVVKCKRGQIKSNKEMQDCDKLRNEETLNSLWFIPTSTNLQYIEHIFQHCRNVSVYGT